MEGREHLPRPGAGGAPAVVCCVASAARSPPPGCGLRADRGACERAGRDAGRRSRLQPARRHRQPGLRAASPLGGLRGSPGGPGPAALAPGADAQPTQPDPQRHPRRDPVHRQLHRAVHQRQHRHGLVRVGDLVGRLRQGDLVGHLAEHRLETPGGDPEHHRPTDRLDRLHPRHPDDLGDERSGSPDIGARVEWLRRRLVQRLDRFRRLRRVRRPGVRHLHADALRRGRRAWSTRTATRRRRRRSA